MFDSGLGKKMFLNRSGPLTAGATELQRFAMHSTFMPVGFNLFASDFHDGNKQWEQKWDNLALLSSFTLCGFLCAAAGFKFEQVDLHVFIRYQDQVYTF